MAVKLNRVKVYAVFINQVFNVAAIDLQYIYCPSNDSVSTNLPE